MAVDASNFAPIALSEVLGPGRRIREITPVHGGSIHTCLRIEDNKSGRYFLKLGDAACAPRFEAEAAALNALRGQSDFVLPEVLSCTHGNEFSALVLEFLDLASLQSSEAGSVAGHALAQLHAHEQAHFGWSQTTYLGRTELNNAPSDHWAGFLVRQRFEPLLKLAIDQGADSLSKPGQALLNRLPALFVDDPTPASLLHGDLWSGNIGALPDGKVAIFDPAPFYGDPEFDLAMTELFGGFPSSFYTAYRSARSPRSGVEVRSRLYKCYHLLNHLTLFGRAYLGETERHMAWLLRHP